MDRVAFYRRIIATKISRIYFQYRNELSVESASTETLHVATWNILRLNKRIATSLSEQRETSNSPILD